MSRAKNNKIKIYESEFDDKKLFEIKTNKKYRKTNNIKKLKYIKLRGFAAKHTDVPNPSSFTE